MKELVFFYVGFTMGMCFMDYLAVKDTVHIHLYRTSAFQIIITLILAPIVFPFSVLKEISNRYK